LEDAHVMQAFMRRNGVACWMVRSNGVPLEEGTPMAEDGYKLFVPDKQMSQALELIRETFRYAGEAPLTGSLDLAFGGRARSVPETQLQDDPVGPEVLLWNPPVPGGLIGDAWKAGAQKCPKCGHEMAADDNFCDACGEPLRNTETETWPTCRKCGHEMPTGLSSCPTCGEIQ
jgi:hypothetical protein